jgi:hypothetical protein
MKTILLTLTALLLYFTAYTQNLSSDKLIGEWLVKNVQVLPDVKLQGEEAARAEQFSKGFIGATFIFKTNKTFDLVIAKDAPSFMHQLKMPIGTQWKYNGQKSLIAVGTEEDRYNLMSIYVKSGESRTYFILDESPFLVEVTKK